MAVDALTAVPSTFRAGDTLALELDVADDYEAMTNTLQIRGPAPFDITGTVSSGTVTFSATAAETAQWPAGRYRYVIVASDATTRYTWETGILSILPNISTDTGPTDIRSHAEQCLELIEAALIGRIPTGMESYSIDGRSISKIPLAELERLRDKYRQEVFAEQQRAAGRTALQSVKFEFRDTEA